MSSPNNLESVVLELVKEYLAKKTFFSIKDIIEFVNYRVRSNPNINRNKIEVILKSLIKKRIIIPGTKLMKNNIIENPKRNEIFNYIKKYPSNINEIMKAAKIGSHHTNWHLAVLEKFQFIRSKKISNRKIFYKFDSNPKFDELYYYLKIKIVQNIINLLEKEKKALKITEITNSLNKNHSTVKKYVDVLINLKLIEIEKEKNKDLFKLNTKKYSKVKKIIRGI